VKQALTQDGTAGKGRRHLIRFSSAAPQ
jgi:hypothetical protein